MGPQRAWAGESVRGHDHRATGRHDDARHAPALKLVAGSASVLFRESAETRRHVDAVDRATDDQVGAAKLHRHLLTGFLTAAAGDRRIAEQTDLHRPVPRCGNSGRRDRLGNGERTVR